MPTKWLAGVVSLQTSIAKHLAQKQLLKQCPEPTKAEVNRPAASGQVQTDSNQTSGNNAVVTADNNSGIFQTAGTVNFISDSEKYATTSTSNTTVGTTTLTTTTATITATTGSLIQSTNSQSTLEIDKSFSHTRGLMTAGLSASSHDVGTAGICSIDSPSVEIKPSSGATISLLNNNSSSSNTPATLNGDVGMQEMSGRTSLTSVKTDALVIKTKTNGNESTMSPSLMKVSWPCGSTAATGGASPTSLVSTAAFGKNLVISTSNKSSNALMTKVVSGAGHGSKIICNNNAKLGANSSMVIQRLAMQPSMKLAGKLSTTISNANGGGGATKVITVSAPLQGSKAVSTSSSLPVSHSKSVVANTLSSSPAIVNLNTTLQHCIEGQGEVELSKLDQKLVQILAWQRLQQLLPQQQTTAASATTEKKSILNGLLSQSGSAEIQARALLCPLTGKGEPVSMPYRALSIGTGADMDVCLTLFGHCNYVSPKHAFIFFDETTRHYELLNYSEHGTTVDNVLYSCDFSDKTATTPQPTPFVASVRSIINKKKGNTNTSTASNHNSTCKKDTTTPTTTTEETKDGEKATVNNRLTMSARCRGVKKQCSCKGSSSSLIGGSGAGWEGTALLHHGSYIKTGCLQFVFSIVDHATLEASHFVKRENNSSNIKNELKSS